MLKYSFISMIAAILLAMANPAQAQQGEMARLVATLSVGYYIQLQDTDPIKVEPDYTSGDPMHTFSGCVNTKVECNFDVILRASARATSPAKGIWKVDIYPYLIPNGITDIKICVSGTEVQSQNLKGGNSDVPVAEIRLEFMAR